MIMLLLILSPPSIHLVVHERELSMEEVGSMEELKVQLAHKRSWMAASIHRGEEESQFLLFYCSLYCKKV